MLFYKGTIEDYNAWIGPVNDAEELPNQYAQTYSEAIQNLSGQNDYIWKYGDYDTLQLPKIDYDQALAQGYFDTDY